MKRWAQGIFGVLIVLLGITAITNKRFDGSPYGYEIYGAQAIGAGVMICIVGLAFVYFAIKKKPKNKS
jgi:hypothetical protein